MYQYIRQTNLADYKTDWLNGILRIQTCIKQVDSCNITVVVKVLYVIWLLAHLHSTTNWHMLDQVTFKEVPRKWSFLKIFRQASASRL